MIAAVPISTSMISLVSSLDNKRKNWKVKHRNKREARGANKEATQSALYETKGMADMFHILPAARPGVCKRQENSRHFFCTWPSIISAVKRQTVRER